jgi:hypothetical protein
MLAVVLLLQLSAAAPPAATYSSPALEAFVAAAAVANRAPPAELLGYRGRIESELSLIVRDTLGRERVAQVEQFAMAARWRRGVDYDLRIVGYRSQTVGVPYSALSFARSWTIPYLYGNRLTLGVDFGQDGSSATSRTAGADSARRSAARRADTLHAVHPLAADRARFYRFAGGDTIAVLHSRARAIPIVRVRVTPFLDSVRGSVRVGVFDGEIDFDADRHEIVRMRGQFVASSESRGRRFSLSRLPGIVAVAYVELVNAEVDGRYWLPAFQRSEFQATFAPLGAGRSVFRLVSRFRELNVTAGITALDSSRTDSLRGAQAADSAPGYRRRLSFAPSDSVSSYRDWAEPMGAASARVSASDFDDLAPDAWRATGAPRFDLAPTKLEELFRFNRVEGAYTGVAASERFRDAAPGLTAHAYGGWAWTERTARGGASVAYQRGPSTFGARFDRALASTNDFTPPLEDGGDGFAALIGGLDDQDYIDRRVAIVSLTRSLGTLPAEATSRGMLVVEAGVGEDRAEVARLGRSPLRVGHFRPNRGSLTGRYARGAATIEIHPDVTGLYLEPGIGVVASYEIAAGGLRWQRAELTIAARKNLSDFVIAARANGGLVAGRPLPPQQLFELGGENALPGYDYKEFTGDRAAAAGLLAGYSFPLLRRPWRIVRSLVIPGLSPGVAVGAQGGWTEISSAAARVAVLGLDPGAEIECSVSGACAEPLSTETRGIRATIDGRVTFFGGLVGVGVARPIDRAARWRLAFRFGQEF